jgi:putative radical SAM enzyme (TIGR03279 family)
MSATISHITEGSIAHEVGLKKGDELLAIGDNPIRDIIDYMYYSKDAVFDLKIQRGNKTLILKVKKKEKADIGFELKPFRIRPCRNKCIFCFVDQLPRGMRKSLYLKDDDYRMSFLYGNYITLTNLSASDKKRIITQKLSPLYVSVHTTDNDLRKKIFGNSKMSNILKEIEELTSHKIRIHAQIVLCPGLNDGGEFSKTIKDLQKFYPYVASIAVVPVGLTKYRKGYIKPVEKSDALKLIETVKQIRRRFKKRHGDPIVHVADECYIKAEFPFPPISEYGDLPQIENGVGLVPAFINSVKKLKPPKKIEPRKIAVFTGVSFMPYLEEFTRRLKTVEGLTLDLFKIENKFFGSTVTVTGLLTGKDILKTIVGKTKADCLLVPDVVLRDGDNIFLDNVTLKDMEESLGMQVKPIEPTPEGLLKGITYGWKWED